MEGPAIHKGDHDGVESGFWLQPGPDPAAFRGEPIDGGCLPAFQIKVEIS